MSIRLKSQVIGPSHWVSRQTAEKSRCLEICRNGAQSRPPMGERESLLPLKGRTPWVSPTAPRGTDSLGHASKSPAFPHPSTPPDPSPTIPVTRRMAGRVA